jgi:hypothetical protein
MPSRCSHRVGTHALDQSNWQHSTRIGRPATASTLSRSQSANSSAQMRPPCASISRCPRPGRGGTWTASGIEHAKYGIRLRVLLCDAPDRHRLYRYASLHELAPRLRSRASSVTRRGKVSCGPIRRYRRRHNRRVKRNGPVPIASPPVAQGRRGGGLRNRRGPRRFGSQP